MQRVACVSMLLLLLTGKGSINASRGPVYKFTTHLICAAAGTAAAVSMSPDALYKKIDQTIRRLNGKKENGVTSSTLDAAATRAKYVEFEKKFNSKYAPLTLDKSARVSIGFSTYLLTLQVLSFLS